MGSGIRLGVTLGIKVCMVGSGSKYLAPKKP